MVRQDIVLLGDFNAGCSYVTSSKWQQIRLFTDTSFQWLIPSDADTTVSDTNCPYDRYTNTIHTIIHLEMQTFNPTTQCICRIVVTSDMMKGVVQDSAEVYNYMTDLNLKQSLVK